MGLSTEKNSENDRNWKTVQKGRRCRFLVDTVPSHAMKEDFFQRADPTLLYEAAELGDRYPLVLAVWKATS